MDQEAQDTLVFILEDNQKNQQVQEDNQPGREYRERQEVREVPVDQEVQAVPVDQEALDTQVDIQEANQESRQVQEHNQLGQE